MAAQIVAALIVLPAAAQVVAPRQHAPVRIHERRFDGSVTSENWSGYAVTGANDSVTDAKGSWVVPAVTCTGSGSRHAPSTYSSFWVGIDGYSSNTVEQTGTDSDCSSGRPTYYAWYEFYPHPSYEVSLAIKPGDTISAEVSYSNGEFTVKLTDETTGKSFSTSARVNSAKRSSAEWIAEAPSGSSGILTLADFGTVNFGEDLTGVSSTCFATVSGTTAAIGSFGANVSSITMVSSSGVEEAVPSGFSAADGSSFSVAWK